MVLISFSLIFRQLKSDAVYKSFGYKKDCNCGLNLNRNKDLKNHKRLLFFFFFFLKNEDVRYIHSSNLIFRDSYVSERRPWGRD